MKATRRLVSWISPTQHHKSPNWRRLRWRLSRFWDAIYTMPLRIAHIARWIPVLWNDYDFDQAYLLRVMAFKMRRMAAYHEKHGITTRRQRTAKELRICAELCHRLNEQKYIYGFGNNDHFKTGWTSHELDWMLEGAPKQDIAYLTQMMRKHLLTWWD